MITPKALPYSLEVPDSIRNEWHNCVFKFTSEVREVNDSNPSFFYAADSFALEIFAKILSTDELKPTGVGAGGVVKRLHEITSKMQEFQMAVEHYDTPDEAFMFAIAFTDKMNKAILGREAKMRAYSDEDRQRIMDSAKEKMAEMSDAQVRINAREAIEQGDEMASMIEAIESVGNLCSNEEGTSMNVSSSEKLLKADKKLKEKLVKIAKAIGRFKAMAQGALSKRAETGKSELHGTKLGGEIHNLITSEVSKLALGGAIAAEVSGRIVNGNAIQFAFRGKQKEGMGPALVYVDGSGSMMDMLTKDETCEQWAKALGITISMIANNQKRMFKYRQFSGYLHEDGGLDNKFTAEKLINAMRFFPNGGTDLSAPINDALRTVKSQKAFQKADLVIITDGVCFDNFSMAMKELKALNVRFHLIKLGNFRTDLQKYADFTYTIVRGASEEEIAKIFSRIASAK